MDDLEQKIKLLTDFEQKVRQIKLLLQEICNRLAKMGALNPEEMRQFLELCKKL